MTDAHDLLTIDEAAALLRTPVATLRYWRFMGTGPHSFRLGRRVVYKRQDIVDWINTQANLSQGVPDGTTPEQTRRGAISASIAGPNKH